jgi:hypothetical protein
MIPQNTHSSLSDADWECMSHVGASKPPKGITLADYPSIVKLWHPTKNGDRQPGDYTHGSHKRVWLQCHGCPTCGEVHQWDAAANNLSRCKGEAVCPLCNHGSDSFCSCRTVAANERLAAEWHEDNPSPDTIARHSNKKYIWRCANAACAHIWEASAHNRRTERAYKCPECARKEGKTQTKHPSLADGCPELLGEWDEAKNDISATEITCGSRRKVWWVCRICGGSWQASVQSRALFGTRCPRRH